MPRGGSLKPWKPEVGALCAIAPGYRRCIVPGMSAQPEQETPGRGSLMLCRVAIDTYCENVAYLHRDCAVYRAEGFQALSKVEVRANGQRILATLNVVDDPSIVGCNHL